MTRTTRSSGKPRRSSRLMDKGIVSRGDGRHKTPSPGGHIVADADERVTGRPLERRADVSDHQLVAIK